ncbi:aldolase [Rossellomorea aquimaris]|uniref:Aldolase n=1 Tax=Rossellomorea aquimaris TaxID=189382 RepID=A0A366ELG7_9BACI|nr:hypothetical protein DET59_11046 [Rossellomorea aquimaris]
MKQLKYNAFGLNVVSDIPFPELAKIKFSNQCDVLIQKSNITNIPTKLNSMQSNSIIEKNNISFNIPGVAEFCIQNGTRITYSPIKNVDENQLRLYILGTCMGALLIQRKTLPLHGSVIAMNGNAYAIIGDSGAGKSTLASSLINRGYQILTDDVIALSIDSNGAPYVYPAYPQQKLWDQSLKAFGVDFTNLLPLFEREAKFAVPVNSHFLNTPLPLAGVFELVKSDGEEVKIHSLENLERLQILYYHTYRNFIVKRLGLMEWHLNYTARFAKDIQMYRLIRPTSRFTANELATLIEETVLKEELVHD